MKVNFIIAGVLYILVVFSIALMLNSYLVAFLGLGLGAYLFHISSDDVARLLLLEKLERPVPKPPDWYSESIKPGLNSKTGERFFITPYLAVGVRQDSTNVNLRWYNSSTRQGQVIGLRNLTHTPYIPTEDKNPNPSDVIIWTRATDGEYVDHLDVNQTAYYAFFVDEYDEPHSASTITFQVKIPAKEQTEKHEKRIKEASERLDEIYEKARQDASLRQGREEIVSKLKSEFPDLGGSDIEDIVASSYDEQMEEIARQRSGH